MLPKIDTFRFAVGSEGGPRSALWYIKIERSGDVYASASSIGGQLKLSLHRDCWCQFGLAGKSRFSLRAIGSSKPHYMFRWKRPATPVSNILHAASVFFPTISLNESPAIIPEYGKFRIIFEPPKGQSAVECGIFYSMLSNEIVEGALLEIGWIPMFYQNCRTGEVISIAYRYAPFTTERLLSDIGVEILGQQELLAKLACGEKIEGSAILANDPNIDGYIMLVDMTSVKASWRPARSEIAVPEHSN